MPVLAKLSDDLKNALGPTLVCSYEALQAKTGSLKDDKDAQRYVEAVTNRFIAVSKIQNSIFATSKKLFQQVLQNHGAMMAVLAFSKPDDVASRLESLTIDKEKVKQILGQMEQAGATDDDVCSVVTSVVTCETSSALLGGGGHHHHGHHHHHRHC